TSRTRAGGYSPVSRCQAPARWASTSPSTRARCATSRLTDPLTKSGPLIEHSFKVERLFKEAAGMTRAETQTRIVDAAFRTLVEEGYHETTMKNIAGRAALATGLATNYFEGKDNLPLAPLDLGCPLTATQLEA